MTIKVPPPENQPGAMRIYIVGRWFYIPVNQNYRPEDYDLIAKDHEMHGGAQFKNSDGDVIIPSSDYQDSRLISMRTYVCPETALINYVYYQNTIIIVVTLRVTK